MNKSELISHISKNAEITNGQANSALEAFIDAISNTLKDGNKITVAGLGTFSISHREARQGRNPQTGETIQIAAKNVAKFKPSKDLSSKI